MWRDICSILNGMCPVEGECCDIIEILLNNSNSSSCTSMWKKKHNEKKIYMNCLPLFLFRQRLNIIFCFILNYVFLMLMVNDCSEWVMYFLPPNEHFVGNNMARTRYFLMRWWWWWCPLCIRPTHLVGFSQYYLTRTRVHR